MKKVALVFIMLLVVSALFAEPMHLGTFPAGRWLDPNYDAVWDFSLNNVRILTPAGKVLHDFSTKTIQNFRFFLDGDQPAISFTCPETGRYYRFVAHVSSAIIVMEIEREALPKYSVKMEKQ